ncbi:hypothetical protein E2562_008766 [Oryza meyeriana var. granulata]|uniref:Uncharacterized protein n=1 Tax=Oryza meyeriana var. granulata TaxID=110450 RepID=A0A6G1CZT7_9ORYZ|nr:hypothetical protein E2562_008766 [Oryza meyeriana var. granulata]
MATAAAATAATPNSFLLHRPSLAAPKVAAAVRLPARAARISCTAKAQAELVDYRGSGMSIMEMSHRGKEFDAAIKKAEADLRAFLAVPDTHEVLFLQSGELGESGGEGEEEESIQSLPGGEAGLEGGGNGEEVRGGGEDGRG